MTTFGIMTSKNKLDKSSLKYKLDLLNKERKADTRMQNTIKQRFQAKYGPLLEKEVVYRPGFCYHRDGAPRDSNEPVSIEETEDYKELLELLFTNGDLDNRKVLCIHVLASHPCECLKPPNKVRVKQKPLTLNKSPMERLIERSKSIMMDPTLTSTHNLPTYILNVNQNKSKPKRGYNQKRYSNECCIRDGRLATRFIVNDFVAQLVSSVIEALHRANPLKMSNLLRMSHNPQFIREILNSSEMQPFLQSLNKQKFLIRSNDRNTSLRSFNKDNFNAIITKSTQWLNFRINEEIEKLHDERIATRNENLKKAHTKEVPKPKNKNLSNESRRFSYLQRKAKNYAQYYGYKTNDSSQVVNNLNLAKIKHEISVKENIKRVKKFLEEPLLEKKIIVSTPDTRMLIQ